jgi:predicted phage baseplate assembly protein
MIEIGQGREQLGGDPRIVRGADGPQPELVAADSASVREAVRDRIPAFTPEWTRLHREDPGVALVRLFGFEIEPVLRRVNRLPEKLLVEYLGTAGVRPLPATAAETVLRFTVGPAAPRAVRVPAGSQFAAPAATGEGELVTFETVADISATAATIVEVLVQEGGLVAAAELPERGSALRAFGRRARQGNALWIGLSPDTDPGGSISLGISIAAPPGNPPPVGQGGLPGVDVLAGPLLRWEALGGGAQPAELIHDETGGLVRSGVIELGVPRDWRPGRPSVLGEGDSRRWLRVRIVQGEFDGPPSLAGLFLNAARAQARRSVRNEALTPAGRSRLATQRMRVTQTPVIPRSLVLEVDEGAAADVFGVASGDTASSGTSRRWHEVEDLSTSEPDDRVFVLDPASGEVTFGDGQHGMRVPQGFRNVIAERYYVGGGAAGAVDADSVKTMLTSLPFVTAVTNPVRASGGTDPEPQRAVVRRGPKQIRARGRAVAVADYGLLALRAPGASIARAHAVGGVHPAHPGAPIPGVVGVFVIPPDRGEGAPTPDEAALRAVAHYLSETVAPAGVEVVAASPPYHAVRAEVQVIVDAAQDPGAVVRAVTLALDEYLHPITGGDDGDGWPFGGPIRYVPLVQRVLAASPAVRAVPRLDLIVDRVRVRPCTDRQLSPNALLWPAGHEVVVVEEHAS